MSITATPYRWDEERRRDEAQLDRPVTPEQAQIDDELDTAQRIAERRNHLLLTTAGMNELLYEVMHTPGQDVRLAELLAEIERSALTEVSGLQKSLMQAYAVEHLKDFLSDRAEELANVPSILREQAA